MAGIIWPALDDLRAVAVETCVFPATDTSGRRYAARRLWEGEEWHTVATDYALGAGVAQYRHAAEALTGGPVSLIGETERGPLFIYDTEEGKK